MKSKLNLWKKTNKKTTLVTSNKYSANIVNLNKVFKLKNKMKLMVKNYSEKEINKMIYQI